VPLPAAVPGLPGEVMIIIWVLAILGSAALAAWLLGWRPGVNEETARVTVRRKGRR
jgi:hypothetical protein